MSHQQRGTCKEKGDPALKETGAADGRLLPKPVV